MNATSKCGGNAGVGRNPAAWFGKTVCIAVSVGSLLFGPVSSAGADTNFGAFSFARSGTNVNLRIDLEPDGTNYFTFEESADLAQFTTRLTALGGGSNAWNFAVINPGGGLDPTLIAHGGGTNAWNFSAAPAGQQLFWRARRMAITCVSPIRSPASI